MLFLIPGAQDVAETAKVAKDALPVITQNPWATLVLVVVLLALASMGMILYAMRMQNKNTERQLELLGKTTTATDLNSQSLAGLVGPINEIRAATLALKDRSDRERE